jgi:hypothetical protein
MKNKINRVCIIDSTYTLLLYFLISTEKEIDTTFYFVSGGPDSVRKRLKNVHYFDRKMCAPFGRRMVRKLICALSLRLFSRIRWPFLKYAEIYGHDNLFVCRG